MDYAAGKSGSEFEMDCHSYRNGTQRILGAAKYPGWAKADFDTVKTIRDS